MRLGRIPFVLMVVAVAIFGLALLAMYLMDERDAPVYAYSDLLADAAAGRVEAITQDGTRLTVSLSAEAQPRRTTVASESINVYAEVCTAAGAQLGDCPIEYVAVGPSAAGQWLGLLITALLPVLLIGGFIYFMMRQAQRGQSGS
jgi:ATP-dependent Zn protease